MAESTQASLLSRLFSKSWERPHWRILYYHAVLPDQLGTLCEQLDQIGQHFNWCSLSDGLDQMLAGTINQPLLSLTFDDGDITLCDDAVLDALDKRGISACCYVVPDYVSRGNTYRDDTPRPVMNWAQLKAWAQAGHEIGSHTFSHVAMSRSSDERCRQEVIRSKDMLEDKLEQSIRHFSYPWGQFSARTTRILRTLNVYDSVATIDRGSMSNHGDPILLRRDRADLYRSGVELENIMRLADRLYALRLLKPSELKKRVQGESIEWQAMDRDDDQGDTGTTSL